MEWGNNMQIAICDDCKKDREILKELLKEYERKKKLQFKIKEYDSGIRLCENERELSDYQLIFLDINMEEEDGMETAMRIREIQPEVHIVLVSAYMNHVLEGYKVRASRFLLKDNLEHTIRECMDDILREIRLKEWQVQYSFVEGNVTLKVEDIIYVETSRHKNYFYTKDEVFSIYKKLDEIENELQGYGFVRTHQSYLVNMRYVEKISSYVMKLNTGEELSVPKSRYQEVKRQFTLFKDARQQKN